jgi:hypothetical protein
MSQSLIRVSNALKKHVPKEIEIVKKPSEADVQFLHYIGHGCLEFLEAPEIVVIQYCYKIIENKELMHKIWEKARLVWSYYDLPLNEYYLSPLGIDPDFVAYAPNSNLRDLGVMTSGYLSGKDCEAIEEVAIAADILDVPVMHLGPDKPGGMKRFLPNWNSINGVSDSELAETYGRCKWVSGLRYIEGFELPILEGLVCGARPIVFDRPEMRYWYEGHVEFVPETYGKELVKHLVEILKREPKPVTPEERIQVLNKFNWKIILNGLWERLLNAT